MKRPDASLISLAGFAAVQWAEQQAANGSNNKARLRRLVAVGLELHERSELYAAAPDLLRSLQTVICHASVAVHQTGSHEMSTLRKDVAEIGGCGGNGAKGRKGSRSEKSADKRASTSGGNGAMGEGEEEAEGGGKAPGGRRGNTRETPRVRTAAAETKRRLREL